MTNILGALLGVMVPLASPVQDQGREPPVDTANTVNPRRSSEDQRGQEPEGRRKSKKHRKHKAPSPRRTT